MIIKETVFDRIGQSFSLLKDNFVGLFLPMFLYNFISVVVVGTISQYYMMKSVSAIGNVDGMDFFSFLNSPVIVMGIVIGAFLYILYLSFYIVVLLGFIKSVKQAAHGFEITILENIKYGVLNFMNSMKTYWYIFVYVAIIPSIIFIVGGILFNAGYYFSNIELLKQAGLGIMFISLIVFIVFAIYRGTKVTFALYSAVDSDKFTKDNLYDSVKVTDENWWRIIGNFLLVGILISLVMGVISGIIGIFSFFSGGGSSILDLAMSGKLSKDPQSIVNMVKDYSDNFSISGEIFSNLIDNTLNTISKVFLLVFTYLFFKRLEGEKKVVKEEVVEIINEQEKNKIEL